MRTLRAYKSIPFFENSADNIHCLQACVKSLLAHYFPEKGFSDQEIDKETLQTGGFSWLPPSVVFLDNLGLDVKLYSKFDYGEFAENGEEFLKATWDANRFATEKSSGALDNILLIQKAAQEMRDRDLWSASPLANDELRLELESGNTFAIAKTVYEWLDNQYVNGTPHFILIIKEYGAGTWRIHDPGIPGKQDRKVPQRINNHDIFGDLLIVKGIK